jgi:hypothetical protein
LTPDPFPFFPFFPQKHVHLCPLPALAFEVVVMEPFPWTQGSRNCLQDNVLVKDDHQRQVGLRALGAFEGLPPDAPPGPECLELAAAAARCSESHVASVGSEILRRLGVVHEGARQTIRRLLKEDEEGARYWAVCAASQRDLPAAFVEEILRTGLADESRLVHMSAACNVMRLRVGALLPDMMKLRARVLDEDDQWWLEKYIALTKDGYYVDGLYGISPKKVHMMTVRIDGDLVGGEVSEDEMAAKGPEKIAGEMICRFLRSEAERARQCGFHPPSV